MWTIPAGLSPALETGPLEVDWAGRMILGTVEFEATFNGTPWEITIYAC